MAGSPVQVATAEAQNGGSRLPAPQGAAAQLLTLALDAVSSRFRVAGLMVAALDRAGAVVYQDPAAAAFFSKYAAPLLANPGVNSGPLAEAFKQAAGVSTVSPWSFLPAL